MASYFHGGAPEIQSDGLQTLLLMNPGYVGYSADAPGPTNMLFSSSPAANSIGSTSSFQSQTQQNQQQEQQYFVGIPLQQLQVAAPDVLSAGGVVPRTQYNLWNQTPVRHSVDLTSQLGLRRPAAIASPQQGLSLSLSPQQAANFNGYQPDERIPGTTQTPMIFPAGGRGGFEEVRFSCGGSPSAVFGESNAFSALHGVLLGSKYLKVAQQLLDEVVNVGKEIKEESPKAKGRLMKSRKEGEDGNSNEWEASAEKAAELTTAEKQELQMKKAKLINMLDEVEQRYRQYHYQMQTVVSTFEAVAGPASARTYTALALQTISRHFRCLRDAITGQIRAASQGLGVEDCLMGSKSEGGGSRLRFVDHHLRQQRALQQLGMMQQHNAWRPQRGLPERSVSVLRAWLFEHFLHPYPKDSDKHMLAKQTGLTRNQVSNWFINARVRLWKPMVEDMYLEETKNQNNAADDKASKSCDANEDSAASKSSTPPTSSPTGTLQILVNPQPPQGMIPSPQSGNSRVPPSYEDEIMNLKLIKRARNSDSLSQNQMAHPIPFDTEIKPEGAANNTDFFMGFDGGRRLMEDHNGYSSLLTANNGGGFGTAYPIGELGRFDAGQFTPRYSSGNGVSLTLGLPHCENLPLSRAQPSYLAADRIPLGRRLELSSETSDYCSLNNNNNAPVSQSPNAYDNISIQISRKRFAAPLLPDYVA